MNILIFKKWAIIAGIVTGSLGLTGALAYAQNANPMNLSINQSGAVKITGQVTANTNGTLSVASWLGNWKVNTSANTNFNGDIDNASEINVGDTISASGKLGTGMTINADKVKDHSVRTKVAMGTVSNINASNGTFILETKNQGDVNIKTDSTTEIFINGIASLFTNLQNGIKAMVKGTVNADGSIQADLIKSPTPNGNAKGWLNLNFMKKLHFNND